MQKNTKRHVSIIVYHYVREIKKSRYPEIKGLSFDLFRQQIKYIQRFYEIIRMEDLISSIKHGHSLPKNALLLTFDDGYMDHFEYVFPVLDKLGVQGSFFPPAKAILEHTVLDVNKIHFILATAPDRASLVENIFKTLDEFREKYSLKDNKYYFSKLAKDSRYDPGEVVFIKRILQRELPEKLRAEMVNRLFRKFVTKDETAFSDELYMNVDQIKHIKAQGMYIGSHGYDHYWLDTLKKEKQEKEIDLSLKFLSTLGCDLTDWVMCYPYGAYNDSLISILKDRGCALGLGIKEEIANLDRDDPLSLPRLDTNSLPRDAKAKPNEWTLRVI